MRYADGGGLTAEGRARREEIRRHAVLLFEQDLDAGQIARVLGVWIAPASLEALSCRM